MEERDEKTASTTVKVNKWWDKVKASGLFAAGLVGAVATILVGLISYYGTIWVGEKEARSRTLDLLLKREVAANDLQMKVFESYVQRVVPALEEHGNDSKKVALAAFYSNFGEFLDTRPMFEAFAQKVTDPSARHELTRLAKRVARRQAEFIKAHAEGANMDTTITLCTKKLSNCSDNDSVVFDLAIHSVSVWFKGEPQRFYLTGHAKEHKDRNPALGDDGDESIDDLSDFVTLGMKFVKKEGMTGEERMTKGPFTFELSYMDTPYMLNIGMRHGDESHHRVALRLVDIDTEYEEHEVKIEILHFPGDVYAATQRRLTCCSVP